MRYFSRFVKTGLLLLLLAIAAAPTLAQYKGKPVKKDKLLNVLRSHQLQSREIVGVIKSNGVDFRVNASVERELVAAGARPEVVAAAKTHYRGSSSASASKGKASTDDEFDDFGSESSLADLQRSVRTNPRSYLPYQQLGIHYLGLKNYSEAEKNMREAINRGGSGVFPVVHDHNGTFTQSCSGTIFVTKNGVQFESDTDIDDTFGIPVRQIKKIEMHGGSFWSKAANIFKAKSGSFHIELEGRNYNFAPRSGNSTESKMLIKLVGK